MLSLNRFECIGNVGNIKISDIADKETGEVMSRVAVLSVATNREYKNKQDKVIKDVQWHRIVCWGVLADVVSKWCVVGSSVFATGRLEYRTYKGNDDENKWITEIIASSLILLDKTRGKKEANNSSIDGEQIKKTVKKTKKTKKNETK